MAFAPKTALVTGCATGIGRAVALALAARGTALALADIDEAGAQRTASEARAQGVKAHVMACDMSDHRAVEAMVDEAWRACGALEFLFSNAGVIDAAPLAEASPAHVEWLFGVNLFGMLWVAQAYVRRRRALPGPGHILFTGSEHSLAQPRLLIGAPMGVYNMTKHAALSLAANFRDELKASGIGVSLLCPGAVATDIGNAGRNRPARFGGAMPAPRFELPKEAGRALMAQMMQPADCAQIALDGIARGLFFIPTHPHIQGDVEARYDEILAAFKALDFA